MGMKKINTGFLLLGLISICFDCYNPFFHKIVTPPSEEALLSTPEGVIKQLKLAYRNNNLDLFKELIFSDSLFRFYIQYNIYKDQNLDKINRTVNLEIDYVPKTEYWYLTSSDEINIHRKLFERGNEIDFSPNGLAHIDTELFIDSTTNPGTFDSLYILKRDKPWITIKSSIIESKYGKKEFTFEGGEQTFIVKRDSNKMWKILYWFELDQK